jgi:hypothetical protein
MANKYIILNGKRYRTVNRSFTPQRKKARQVNVTVGNKTAIQTFNFTDYRWKVDIFTAIQVADSQYGTLADLQIAYDQAYVAYTDALNQVHDVVLEGELATPLDIGILHDQAPFKVTLSLRKRQP